jgi:rhodanese-related sulfurtransferase
MAVKTIKPEELNRLHQQGNAVEMIDVRTPAEYAQVHAEGAKLVSLDRLDPKALLAERDGNAADPIYVLCHSGARGAKACTQFEAAGFSNVFNVEGGTVAWEQAGLPVVCGASKVISLERQVRIVAGTLVLIGVVLGTFVHPAFYGLSAFVGAGLVFAGITDWCGMGLLLAKAPWNRSAASSPTMHVRTSGGRRATAPGTLIRIEKT